MRKQQGCDFVAAKRNPNEHKEEFTTSSKRKVKAHFLSKENLLYQTMQSLEVPLLVTLKAVQITDGCFGRIFMKDYGLSRFLN